MSRLSDLAKRQRAEVLAEDEKNLEAIARAYTLIYDRMRGDVDALALAIEQLEAPTSAKVKNLPQYKRLVRRAGEEIDRFVVYLETVVGTAAAAAIALGLGHSAALVNVATGGGFVGLEPAVMGKLLDYLRPDGPLYARLKLITGGTQDRVVQAILDGVGLGQNPRTIAAAIQDAFGGGLTDALRHTRTVQLYAYRDSTRANYMATGGIVTGWVWMAELDADVCLSCVAQHGTIHDLNETLDDHYNGRCAALPYIPDFGNPVEQSGQDWFDSLPSDQQSAMMGAEKHGAYVNGQFTFDQLSTQQANDIYGTMRTETPLKDLIGK